MKKTACERNHDLLVQMLGNGNTLTEIAQAVGTNRTRVKEYLDKQGIPYKFGKGAKTPERNGRWKGGRSVDKDGYILIKKHGHPYADRHNYVREHRLVMEAHLGRYLLPHEVVHHKDDDKQNNQLDNLELFGSNAEHLAETLKGQVPNWTEDGKRRILEGVRKAVAKRKASQD